MNPDRALLKLDARDRMRRCRPNPILIGMIVFLLTWVMQYLSLSVLGLNFEIRIVNQNLSTYEDLIHFMEGIQKQMLAHFHPTPFAVILAVALWLMNAMVNIGHMIYALHITREEKADYGNLLDGFSMFGRAVLLSVLQFLIIYLFAMLLIIPGIIMAYRYRQAIFLLIDNPDRSPVECLRASGEMMRGHKWELFVLDLSFIGWILVQSLFPPFAIWLRPYQMLTYANYYRVMRGEPVPAGQGKQYYEGRYTEIPPDEDNDRDNWDD